MKASTTLVALVASLITSDVEGFGFELPKIQLPWTAEDPAPATGGTITSALEPGDTVAVVGASGNVGKLVALRLSDSYKVNGIVRDSSSVEDFFEGREGKIELRNVDLLDEMNAPSSPSEQLRGALESANALVICTGTTAFPTKAWSRSGEADIAGDVISALLDNKFDVQAAIASLDEQSFNTPANVDASANEYIVDQWVRLAKVPKKRVVMLSSIGVQRRDQMPFPILNACGVLNAKARGEAAIEKAAADNGFSYTIVRPGQLFGGPYTNNYYLGTLFQLDKDASTQDVEVGRGDELLGDTLRSTLAEVTAQICETDCARDMDFAVVNVKGEPPSDIGARLKAQL
ncbi:hypothetical protein THAOC_00127 [Thalassiosira oceanica]|uniref:NAD(P)-binding domain-containing protein n=1 Tax=Thalassiosira oceanica TaxID=159749 RepID=K0TGW2_THAOC|nr:hypothetical protein THAOC_00127 [Thalassiosira oceanica]|eukprot:EJK78003.1 hypothetical protein THAOC_00127 [Thalassiosira oceanica]